MNTPLARWRFDLAGWSREATAGPSADFFALFDTADRLGFGGIWFHEFRLLADAGPYPSPLLLAAAVLARTERLRVGVSALVLPLHAPQLLAEELLQLQHQSQNRFDAGVGRGTDPRTLAALSIDPADTRARFEHGCRSLRAHAPSVPLYVAGSTPETLGLALALDLPLLLSLEPPELAQLACVRSLLGDAPAPASLLQSSLSRYVCIAPKRDACEAMLQPVCARLQARKTHFALKRGVAPDQVPQLEPARMLKEQFICGTPDDCIAQLLQLGAATGMRSLRCVFNANGQLSNAQALAGMDLFAREVLPVLGGC